MAQLDQDQIILEKAWFIFMSAAALVLLTLPQLYIKNIDSLSSLRQFLNTTDDLRIGTLVGLWGIGVAVSAVCFLYFICSLSSKRQLSPHMQYAWFLSFGPTALSLIIVSDIYTKSGQVALGEHIGIVGFWYIVPFMVGLPLLIIRQGRRNYIRQRTHQQASGAEPTHPSFWKAYKRRIIFVAIICSLIVIASPELYSVRYFANLALGVVLIIILFTIYDKLFKYSRYYWDSKDLKQFLRHTRHK